MKEHRKKEMKELSEYQNRESPPAISSSGAPL
jgi:hypothetical protein